jgi:Tfp pilus assembly protein FimT
MDKRRTMGSKSEHISLGTIARSDAVARTIAESTYIYKRRSDSATTKCVDKRWIKHEGLRQLAQVAVRNNVWIDNVTDQTDGESINNGTENTVYLSKDGRNVIKVNNFFFLNEDDIEFTHSRDLKYFFNRIIAHNLLFPEISYKIIGFTKNNIGQICAVMEQSFIPIYEYASYSMIDEELSKRGFVKTILGKGVNFGLNGYTNGIFELTDAKPQNVLRSKSGILYFVDLDISTVLLIQ